jgi:hypothetical protein
VERAHNFPQTLGANICIIFWGDPLLIVFIDLVWPGDPNDKNSTTIYVFSIGSRLVTWACKKQYTTALSLVKVEYQATVNASQESVWLRQIISEFGF